MKRNKALYRLASTVAVICLKGLILSILISGSAESQDIQSDLSGFSASVDLHYSNWNTSADFIGPLRDLDSDGIGVRISGGYGFNQRFEAMASYAFSNFNQSGDWSIFNQNEFGAGLRYNFGATLSKIRPFVDGMLNINIMNIDPVLIQIPGGGGADGEFQMSGYTIGLGGGARYFFKPYLAATASIRMHYGSDYELDFDGETLTVDESQDVTQWYFGAGVSWYFGKRF